MKLIELANTLGATMTGTGEFTIARLTTDSREVKPGDLFFARRGEKFNGADFVAEAVQKGAAAVVVPDKLKMDVPQLICDTNHENLKRLCELLYQKPTEKMSMIGVTGTNGKTSTSYFIEAMLAHAGKKTGYIGTTEYRWGQHKITSKLTTPMYETLQFCFGEMQKDKVDAVVMECSSHGIELGRIDDIAFDVCVYTNLTHEHLDFHGTMENYEKAKAKLFEKHLKASSKKNKLAVINISDAVGKRWVENKIFSSTWTYGLEKDADVYPVSIETQADGMKVILSLFGEKMNFFMPTLGVYNVMNVMAALLVSKKFGIDLKVLKEAIEKGIYVPGRLEKVQVDAPFNIIVDYAYTEDALRNVLQTLQPFRKNRIITVFGCGGDRDATRRPKMAKTVYDLSDKVVVTTDNPRTEDPASIIEEIVAGIKREKDYQSNVQIEVDRRKAIEKSLQIAQPGDIILIAGKGHETYQEVHGVRYPFDDREIVKTCWKQK